MNLRWWLQYLSIVILIALVFREVRYGASDEQIFICFFASLLFAGIACFIKEDDV
jgi:hypothetical protein